jgi:hypothetical protein
MDEYVVFRTESGELEWVKAKTWDSYVLQTTKAMKREVSRGHSISEAYNLTVLANKQREIEK